MTDLKALLFLLVGYLRVFFDPVHLRMLFQAYAVLMVVLGLVFVLAFAKVSVLTSFAGGVFLGSAAAWIARSWVDEGANSLVRGLRSPTPT
jgi:hypothetical protein